MNLSDDEFTILMIAAQGESLMAIAHWKAPVESLIQKGYLQSRGGDNFNCVITELGRVACQTRDQNDQDAFAASVMRFRQEQVIQEVLATKELPPPPRQKLHCPHCGGTLQVYQWDFSDG
jgi:hypothetical protein